jgi:aromatic ring-cleaving dioxygenase
MNTYVFVLATSVLSIAACSYHQALEILVHAVGVDDASDYLFSELN